VLCFSVLFCCFRFSILFVGRALFSFSIPFRFYRICLCSSCFVLVLLWCLIWCGVVVGGGGGWWFLTCLLLVGLVLAELPAYFGSGDGFDLVVR
jgi:hypothetical protein